MPKKHGVERKHSITATFLRVVFLIYLIVSIAVSFVHMAFQYMHKRNKIIEELKIFENTFESSLAEALWQVDEEQIRFIVGGIGEIHNVVGVKIEDPDTKTILGAVGTIKNQKGKCFFNPKPVLEFESKKPITCPGLFQYQFSVIKYHDTGKENLAIATLYSSSRVVFQEVIVSFLFLIIHIIIITFALWMIFSRYGRILLNKPLTLLTEAAQKIDVESMEDIKIDIKSSRRNELKVLEEAFNSMIRKLMSTQKELKQSEERFRGIFENATEGIFQTKLDGEILIINPAFATTLGYESAIDAVESIKYINNIFYEFKKFLKFQQNMQKKGQVEDFEILVFKKDKSIINIVMNAHTILDEHKVPLYYEGTILDITAKKHSERLQREKDIAEKANQAKTQFLANMSHEIRTPMNSIIGLADLLKKTKVNKKQKELISIINMSAGSLLNIINDILDISKIESGTIELVSVHFSIRELVDNVIKSFQFKVHEKKLKMDCQIADDVPEYVLGDKGRINQILINLLGNSVKFTEKGEIKLNIKVRSIKEKKVILRFVIKDSGIGIPEEKLKTIFDPFVQVDISNTREYGGTGLGLTITKKLIEMMAGRIEVKSYTGKGSTFIFEFPLQIVEKEPVLDKISKPDKIIDEEDIELSRTLNILVAEDHFLNQRFMEIMLESYKQKFTIVSNGKEALKALENGHYDCILMDGQMPVMDGFETTRAIRKNEKKTGKHIPIFGLTAAALKGDKKKYIEAGMDGYITKPIDKKKFLEILNKIGS